MSRSALAATLLVFCCAHLAAQTSRPAADPEAGLPLPARRSASTVQGGAASSVDDPLDLKRVGLALGLVLVAILAGYKVLRRFGPSVTSRPAQSLEIVSRLNVSPRQQILLLRVGRRCVLVGNSGAQMAALGEIADPDEVALLLGQSISEREGSSAATFGTVLGGAQQQFEQQVQVAAAQQQAAAEAAIAADPAMTQTREELSGMRERLRALSQQFAKS